MGISFETGKLYKFTDDGEDLPVESEYKRLFDGLKVDPFGYYTSQDFMDCTYVQVKTGTIALCIGEGELHLLTRDLKRLVNEKYYRLLIDQKVVILLYKEKNLFSYKNLPIVDD